MRIKIKKARSGIGWFLLCAVLLFLGSLCYYSAIWYVSTYGTLGFDSILYTLTNNLDGVQSGLVLSYCANSILPAAILIFLFSLLMFPYRRKLVLRVGTSFRMNLLPFHRILVPLVSLPLFFYFMATAAVETELVELLKNGSKYSEPSLLYETWYADPKETEIIFPEKKRNLIYIFLESMETTFMDRENGGALEYNTIPELTQLAQENISFSHRDGVGGFFAPSGTTWTMAAMTAHTSGIPLKTPPGVDANGEGGNGSHLPGVRSLPDILKDNGYTQMLMVGSKAELCGRKQFYSNHGTDFILDYDTAIADSIIEDGYYVWWGMEDAYLYTYAKQELTRLAAGGTPFAFTTLTVDTHHIDGYRCDFCEDQYPEQYENVYSCASRQLDEFVTWLQAQDFYENTTVIIVGDHPSMDGAYISRCTPEGYERYVYNCFLNSAVETDNIYNRQFTTVDLFPTTLAAMGCTIEGDRLGLGVNLFSETPTLMETMGKETLDFEFSRYSEYYVNNFFTAE